MSPDRLALASTLALACLLQPFTSANARLRAPALQTDQIEGREVLLQPAATPRGTPPQALLVVLHGGGGNAQHLSRSLNLRSLAEQGVVVAYLNGSPAGRLLPDRMKAWNAGQGCCGQPYDTQAPDVDVVQRTVATLAQRYQLPADKVFALGHSNGAMMMQTLMCQRGVFAQGVSMAGALMADGQGCPAAPGRRIWAVHGRQDANVPPEGGRGTEGIARVPFVSEAQSQARFQAAGGRYELQWVDSDHALDHLVQALEQAEGLPFERVLAKRLGW
jgi:poly(3-hydroxybutyrate) depolymerase